jgi:hypothetical protein
LFQLRFWMLPKSQIVISSILWKLLTKKGRFCQYSSLMLQPFQFTVCLQTRRWFDGSTVDNWLPPNREWKNLEAHVQRFIRAGKIVFSLCAKCLKAKSICKQNSK